ncbi:MAG: hypothetical protein ACRDZM_02020, partial [Acidimicrobiia bacterium]
LVEIDNDKATAWLSKGAQPTEAVEKLLNISGAMNSIKMRSGQIHVVGSQPAAAVVDEPAVAQPAVGEPAVEEPAPDEAAAEAVSEEE